MHIRITRFPFSQYLIFFLMIQGICGLHSQVLLQALASDEKLVIGWVEKVQLMPQTITVQAKIDTGADNSSLNVDEITEFTRHGETWVRFSFSPKNNEPVTLERKVTRYAKIKQKSAKSQKRPVVLLDICLGKTHKSDVVVNLADRGNFTYNMLIGRSFLKNTFIVDPSVTYTLEPSCPCGQSIE